MKFSLISIFPKAFDSYLNESMIKRAISRKLISVDVLNPRDFAKNQRKVDARPYGGGPGMVLMAEPILKAVDKARGRKKKVKTLIMSPRGKKFTNKEAIKIAKNYDSVILIAGRYEGVDARVKKALKAEEISVGDYTLTGGELPAMIILDAVSRQIPGVLGKDESLEEKRVASGEVYTRPEVLKYKKKNYKVPKVLLSGNHKDIENWRVGK